MRLIEHLMMQVEHILVINQLTVVSKEVVEITHKNLILGSLDRCSPIRRITIVRLL